MQGTKDQSIWKRENITHITKMSIEGVVATASLAGAITAILIASKVIAGPASLALVASPAGIAVLFIAAVYFAAAAYISYQQMHAKEGPEGKPGEKGQGTNFAALFVGDVQSKIVKESVAGGEQLFLVFTPAGYNKLVASGTSADTEITLMAGDKEVKFKHTAPSGSGATEHKVQLISINEETALNAMEEELGSANLGKSLQTYSDRPITLKDCVRVSHLASQAQSVS